MRSHQIRSEVFHAMTYKVNVKTQIDAEFASLTSLRWCFTLLNLYIWTRTANLPNAMPQKTFSIKNETYWRRVLTPLQASRSSKRQMFSLQVGQSSRHSSWRRLWNPSVRPQVVWRSHTRRRWLLHNKYNAATAVTSASIPPVLLSRGKRVNIPGFCFTRCSRQ